MRLKAIKDNFYCQELGRAIGVLRRSKSRLGVTLGLAALLACSDKITSPTPTFPPTQPPKPPTQQQNRPPVWNSNLITKGDEHSFYQYEMKATDPEGDPVSYSISQAPTKEFSISNNFFYGHLPEVLRDSVFPVRIKAWDGKDSTIQAGNITVRNLYNLHVIPANNLLAVNDSILLLSQPISNLEKNDVIGLAPSDKAPHGFLGEVISFSPDRRMVTTTQASLEQVIQTDSVQISKDLSPSDIKSFTGVPGISRSPGMSNDFKFGLAFNNVILYDEDGKSATTDDRIVANGSIYFNLGFDFGMKVGWFKLRKLSFEQRVGDAVDLTIGANLLYLAAPKKVKVAEYVFSPILITPTPFPIWGYPSVELNVKIDPTKANPLSLRVKQEAQLTGGVTYDGEWTPYVNFDNTFEFSVPSPTGDMEIKASAGPEFKFAFFGAAGISAGADAYLRFASQSGNWGLYGGLEALIGVYAKLFSKTLASYSKKILGFEKLLLEGKAKVDTTFTDSRDGKTYKMVKIGDQTWMAENLIFNATNSEYYQNNPSYVDIYGRLYDWNSSRTACPSAWHLPTEAEWRTLSDYLGGAEVSGGKMKATGTIEAGTGRWRFSSNSGATNESGFTAQPGGKKEGDTYSNEGYRAYFWAIDNTYAISKWLNYASTGMNSFSSPYPAGYKFSIRCVKN